jgi:Ca2+-binding EF-hand superfamily protein
MNTVTLHVTIRQSFCGLSVFIHEMASTPTREMRSELEAVGTALPDDERLAELAKLFIDRLGALRSKLGEKSQGAISWHQLFSQVDEDGSGVITFDELEVAVRSKLKLSSKDFSRASLKALWCALDGNDDDSVAAEEFKRFIIRGGLSSGHGPTFGGKSFAKGGAFSSLTTSEALASTPTREMRAELEAAGMSLPSNEELATLAQLFYQRLEAVRISIGTKNQGTMSWHNLFTALDVSGDGVITFDELERAIRTQLKLGPKLLSAHRLKALFCSLDANDDNSVRPAEFKSFLDRYTPPKRSRQRFGGKGFVKGGALSEITISEALATAPTKVMRAELEAAGEPLPDEAELDAIARTFYEQLEQARHRGTKLANGIASW